MVFPWRGCRGMLPGRSERNVSICADDRSESRGGARDVTRRGRTSSRRTTVSKARVRTYAKLTSKSDAGSDRGRVPLRQFLCHFLPHR